MRLSWASLMPIVNEALSFTPQMGTAYLSAFYMGYAIMVLPGGILADRIGYRYTILVSLLAMAVITALMSTIDNYTYGWVLRFLLGIVSGPVQASCLSAIGDYFGPNQRGAAVGIFMSCTSLGLTTVNLYAPYVATNYGWQNAFLLTAVLPILVFILSYFTVRKPSAEILAQREAEVSAASAHIGEKTSLKENLLHVLKNRNICCLAFAGFFATGATWAVAQWSNLYMVKQLGVNAIYAGHVMSAFGLAALIAKPTIGILSDILPIKKNHLVALVMFLFAPALILAQSVSRMANLLNGDAFGHPTGGNFGILYPESTLAHRTYGNQPLWPAEIWEGQIDILIFVALLLFGSFKHAKGQVFVLYAILYSTARFFLEFLRGDYVNLTLGLKSAQMTSLIVIIVGICLFIYLGYLEKKNQKVIVATEPTVKTKKRK